MHALPALTAALAATALLALVTGVVPLPDVEALLADVAGTLGAWTYLLVGGLALLETGAFVGLVAPGETALLLGGVVAAQGGIELSVLIPLAWLAAAAGDLISFGLGRRLGRGFLIRRGPSFGVTAARMRRVESFFADHGAKAILLGRFVGIIRAVAPFLAGASGMPVRAFLPWSLLGTAVWATAFTLVGFTFHRSFSAAADILSHGALAAVVIAALVLIWRRHRARPAAIGTAAC